MKCSGVEVTAPSPLLNEWKDRYGEEDLVAAICQIKSAFIAIDSLRSSRQHNLHHNIATFWHHITDQKILDTNLGKYIQIAIRVGHRIDGEKFLLGSGSTWNREFPMKLEGVFWKGMSGTEHLVQVEISYRGDKISVMNTLDKIRKLVN